MTQPADYGQSVFINCPFDDQYAPLSRAIAYTVIFCGFYARSALEEPYSDNRLKSITRLIRGCRYGIHDLSRTELNANGLPRFNMPFELGMFVGAAIGGGRLGARKWLVLDTKPYRYQEFISDIAGCDPAPHGGEPAQAVMHVRNWLQSVSGRQLPSGSYIFSSYEGLQAQLPEICSVARLDAQNLTFRDFTHIAFQWIRTTEAADSGPDAN